MSRYLGYLAAPDGRSGLAKRFWLGRLLGFACRLATQARVPCWSLQRTAAVASKHLARLRVGAADEYEGSDGHSRHDADIETRSFHNVFPSPLRIAAKKFQEILRAEPVTNSKAARSWLAENDWQPERLPYNV